MVHDVQTQIRVSFPIFLNLETSKNGTIYLEMLLGSVCDYVKCFFVNLNLRDLAVPKKHTNRRKWKFHTSETSSSKLLHTHGGLFPQLFFQLKLCECVRWISHKGMVRSKPVNAVIAEEPFRSTRT